MTLDEQLKALTDSELAELVPSAPLLGERDASVTPTPRQPGATPSSHDEILVKKISLELESGVSGEFLAKNGWKCSRCQTLNGMIKGKKTARKSCKKCLKLRTDECLLIEELILNKAES